MDNIRKFLERKKMDKKFKQAGTGHKLSDQSGPSTVSSRSTQPQSEHYRRQQSSEANKAGEAALKRFEQKSQPSRPVSARATWKHQTSGMITEDMKEQVGAELTTVSIEQPDKPQAVELAASPALATSGIYFCCPLCPVCLSEPEIYKHLEECLLKDLHMEPATTTALMIHTLNQHKDKVMVCINILGKYLTNILSHPTEEKYRKIKKSNKVFRDKVAPLKGVTEFLTLGCGFVETELPVVVDEVETHEQFFVLPSDLAQDTEKLKLMQELLQEAEPLKVTLDRSIRIFEPGTAPGKIELPSDFFSVTTSEIKCEQQAMTDEVEKNKRLRTKAMREMESRKDQRKYKYSVIRIRFPDDSLIQGTFYSHETLMDILQFVTDSIENTSLLFSLVSSTGKKCSDHTQTIEDLGLSPAAVLNFTPDTEDDQNFTKQYLKRDLLLRMEKLS